VELLVAMIIFTIIAGASWALLDSGRGVAAHGTYEAARLQMARTALRAITADVRGAFSGNTIYDTGLVGTRGGTEDRPLDTLALVSFAHQPSPATTEKEMDLVRIAYSIDEDARTKQTGLVREKRRRITETITVLDPGASLEEIASEVVGLRFRYYDGAGWLDSWDSPLSGTMPKAIEAAVTVKGVWRGTEELEIFTTRVYLPIAAAAPRKTP
jgi:hypothetical protein